VIFAENEAQRFGSYRVSRSERAPIDAFIEKEQSLLILAAQNDTVRSLRPFFNRRIPIWEGYTRDTLNTLIDAIELHSGDAVAITKSMVIFLDAVAIGFTPSAYGNSLQQEVRDRCAARRRGKPAELQKLARLLIESPDHRGIARALRKLEDLARNEPGFSDIKIDLIREFWDAAKLLEFENCQEGLAEITRRRTHARPSLPKKAISTVHKAKGHECDSAIIMPCDGNQFGDNAAKRRLLYVAISRAKRSLALVIPKNNPSPLFIV
jgi:hypothetical protein